MILRLSVVVKEFPEGSEDDDPKKVLNSSTMGYRVGVPAHCSILQVQQFCTNEVCESRAVLGRGKNPGN